MLYRIVENGYPGEENRIYYTVERIEGRFLWWRFWETVQEDQAHGFGSYSPLKFLSVAQAKAWIEEDKVRRKREAEASISATRRRVVYQEPEGDLPPETPSLSKYVGR